jgi:hypothetical protein
MEASGASGAATTERGLIDLTPVARAEFERLRPDARALIGDAIAKAAESGATVTLVSAAAVVAEGSPSLAACLEQAAKGLSDRARVQALRRANAERAGKSLREARAALRGVSLATESARDALRVVDAMLLGLQDEADDLAGHCTCSEYCVEPREPNWDLATWRDRVPAVSRALRGDGGASDRVEVAMLIAEIAKELLESPSQERCAEAAAYILDSLPSIVCDADGVRFAKYHSPEGIARLAGWLTRVSLTSRSGKLTPARIAAKLLLVTRTCGVSASQDEAKLTEAIAKAVGRKSSELGEHHRTPDVG